MQNSSTGRGAGRLVGDGEIAELILLLAELGYAADTAGDGVEPVTLAQFEEAITRLEAMSLRANDERHP